MVGESTKIAIDNTILKRLEAVQPAYATRKVYINTLLDQLVTKMENEQRAKNQDW